MRLLLIVGTANDVFIYNMSKWLKKSMDVIIDVFEFYPSNKQGYDNLYYNNVESVCMDVWHNKIKGVRGLVYPFYGSSKLRQYLNNRHYDIIHCHWLVPPLVLTKGIHDHCKKLYVTFWGGELEALKILFSKTLYKRKLERFLGEIDYFIGSKSFKYIVSEIYPSIANKHIEGYLGSAPLEVLYQLMKTEEKNISKEKLSIDVNKLLVLIGYSGKSIHQHIPIIEELAKRENLKNRIHLLAPMTRGANKDYTDKVKNKLEVSGYSYTLIQDRFLTDLEVARIRNATDVTLQFSTFDGFSRSIVECLCAKSVLIYGDWLHYKTHLKNNELKGIHVGSIKEGIDKLCEISQCIYIYNDDVVHNSLNGKKRNLWSECIKDWVNAYKRVL